jgi:tetratricopeptide (TPR) repeat protein
MCDRPGEGTTLNNVGFTYYKLGSHRKALKFYKQALAIHQLLGDTLGEISTLLNMGNLYVTTKRKKFALLCYRNAQELAEQIEDQSIFDKVKQCMDAL